MSNYTKSTNFATKDTLTSGDPLKIVKGTEINTEFDNIATAVNSKSDTASPTFTGTVTAAALTTTGNTILGDASTDTLNVGNGGLVKDASGNVGIGTSSPTGKLHVSGFVLSSGQNYSARFSDAVNSTYSITHQSGLTNLITDTAMAFYSSNTERMRIDSSGALIVGNTATFGSGKINTYYTPGTTTGVSFLPTTNANTPTPCNFLNAAGTSVGSIVTSVSGTAYNTTSDYRLKENVQSMAGALAKVAALKPVTYKWKVDESAGEGFIAHELAEVCPHAVTGEKDAVETYKDENGNEQTRPKYQGIDTSFLVATLTAAVQELNAKFEEYKAAHP
jgi:hypothetical protein